MDTRRSKLEQATQLPRLRSLPKHLEAQHARSAEAIDTGAMLVGTTSLNMYGKELAQEGLRGSVCARALRGCVWLNNRVPESLCNTAIRVCQDRT